MDRAALDVPDGMRGIHGPFTRWRQADGALCDMVCRGLPLMEERAGQIELPGTCKRHNPLAHPAHPAPVLRGPDTDRTKTEGPGTGRVGAGATHRRLSVIQQPV